MAYSAGQWAKIKALFELGVSLKDISKEIGIDKAAVSRRAKAEGWEKAVNQPLVDIIVKAKQQLKEVDKIKSTKSQQEVNAIDTAVEKRLMRLEFFDNAHVLVAQVTVNKIKVEGEAASFQDLSAAANTITKAREGVMGKTPDVAIQVNNNGQQVTEAFDRSPERVRAARAFLDSAI